MGFRIPPIFSRRRRTFTSRPCWTGNARRTAAATRRKRTAHVTLSTAQPTNHTAMTTNRTIRAMATTEAPEVTLRTVVAPEILAATWSDVCENGWLIASTTRVTPGWTRPADDRQP